jgi:hypothetical protein
MRAYHACLYTKWIDRYCWFHVWGVTQTSFRDCVVANGGCECVNANVGYWGQISKTPAKPPFGFGRLSLDESLLPYIILSIELLFI